ncbi:hypothetical protein N7491_002334 [Penicillium cf. griseofulvum]|uniref:Uncharacterized protein n=1 Tax=Penicillium cf. griseofulvum TaxID=2972120 RepID=A0A9W9T384_9EURO|nr:hypothetical protein N7472_003483 [Penicillium cf. griseofulvum]KAJ5446252.1 hypothetical protein N7491_002334 [Penicillium cf. griseofulvum]
MPSQLAWIWPKDPRPGNPQQWPRRWRLFDVLTNKGPDIYVGQINHRKPSSQPRSGPTRQEWSRWENSPNDPDADYSPLPWAGRPAGERYDFRTRKYHVPDRGTWSAVEYCNGRRARKGKWAGKQEVHCVPMRYWDRNGVEYPAEFWHNSIYGKHGDRGNGWDEMR